MKISLNKASKILFVCHSNAGRSHFAQGFYNYFTGTKNAESAGVNPEIDLDESPTLVSLENHLSNIKPNGVRTTDTMKEVGIDVTDHIRQRLSKPMLKKYDLVVNLTERHQTPDWLRGDNVVWWDVADPHGDSWEKNRRSRDEIEWRVRKLIDNEIINETKEDA